MKPFILFINGSPRKIGRTVKYLKKVNERSGERRGRGKIDSFDRF